MNRSLRGMYEVPVIVEESTNLSIGITLREPLPQDPPIVVNLPQLLFEEIMRNRAK